MSNQISREEKVIKGVKTIEKIMKILADKHIHKLHDYMECFIQNNRETGRSFRERIPEDLEDEILNIVRANKLIYVKRNRETNKVFCYVYDIDLTSLYFKIKVKLSKNNKLTLALSKWKDLASLVSDCGYRGKYLTADFDKIIK